MPDFISLQCLFILKENYKVLNRFKKQDIVNEINRNDSRFCTDKKRKNSYEKAVKCLRKFMRVYNPMWLQVIFYAAIAGFPCLTGYMFYLAFDLYLKSGAIGAGGCLLLGFGVGYISYIGIQLAKFVPAVVEFDDEHFTVSMQGLKTSYKWSDIASVKNYEGSQILKLFDKSGKTIYVVDHMTPGYQNFAQKVEEAVGI